MLAKLVDKWCLITSLAILLFSWLLFWNDTGDPIGSFSAAVIAAGLFFLVYVGMRLLYLTFKTKN